MTDAALWECIRQAIANLRDWLGREPDAEDIATALTEGARIWGEPEERVRAVYVARTTMQGAG